MLEGLKKEMAADLSDQVCIQPLLLYEGFRAHFDDSVCLSRGYAAAALFRSHKKYIYDNDMIVGSIRGLHAKKGTYSDAETEYAKTIVRSYDHNTFRTGESHYAPDYETPLAVGVGGMLQKIEASMAKHAGDADKTEFLKSMHIAMEGFADMIRGYGEAAAEKADKLCLAKILLVRF